MSWYVYIIEASDQSLYTGITTDLERRFTMHREKKGAKFFYSREPVRFVYQAQCLSRSEASKRECEIKALSRKEKRDLISSFEKAAAD